MEEIQPTTPLTEIEKLAEKDDELAEQVIPLFATMMLKRRKRMLYVPLDFDEITLDALVDSGASFSIMSETDVKKIKEITPKNLK